jgi:Tol biopolymer transport system component
MTVYRYYLYDDPPEPNSFITYIAWSPDNSLVATAIAGTVDVWSVSTGNREQHITGDWSIITTLLWTPDNRLVLTTIDSVTAILNPDTGEAVNYFYRHSPDFPIATTSLVFDRDGQQAAMGDQYGAIFIWEDTRTSELWTSQARPVGDSVTRHNEAVRILAWHPSGQYLASGSWDGSVRIWDPEAGELLEVIEVGEDVQVNSVAWRPGSYELAYGKPDGTVEVIVPASVSQPPTPTADPNHVPDTSYQIIFASDRGGSEGPIYMMNPDGTNIHLLPINDGMSISPACSSEGAYIAFYSEIGLQVADASFTCVQTVVPRASSLAGFSLSASAGKVAFVRVEDGNRDIYVSNIDGTGQTRLTTHPGFDIWPALSPDGTKVVFASNRSGQPNNYELYIIDADGSNLMQLTNTGGSNTDPSWSPDGTKIAFTSDRAGNGSLNIYVMNLDGSNPIPLTQDNVGNYQPAWSPDGTQIAFVSNRDGEYVHQIYVMNADGSNVARVTNDPYFNDQPCWLIIPFEAENIPPTADPGLTRQ